MEGKWNLEWWPPAKSHSCMCQGRYLNLAALFLVYWASLMAQLVKNLPAIGETWVWSLGWEVAMEKGTATHSSILAWRVPWTEQPGELQSMRSQRGRYGWATYTLLIHQGHFIINKLWSSWEILWRHSLVLEELTHTHTHLFLFNCRRYIYPKMKIPHSKTLWLIVLIILKSS